MYLSAQDVRSRVLAAETAGCTDGRLCYGAPFGPDQDPYGVAIVEFEREYPVAAGRVDVEMDRCPGAIPRIIVWLNAGERPLTLPVRWRGFPVVQRPPVAGVPFGQEVESETKPPAGPTTSQIPEPVVQQAEFPVGPIAFVFGAILTTFVLSFFVKQSPAGRWYFDWRERK